MKRHSFLLVALACLIALGIWGWRAVFPSPEQAVRLRLLALARTASASVSEEEFAKQLAEFFAEDVLVQVEIGSGALRTLNGREEFLQTAKTVRGAVGGLRVEFPDLNVAIGPDKRSADVDLTAKIRVPIDRELIVQELRFTLQKKGRDWLIRRIQTVKTLAQTAVARSRRLSGA